MNWRPEQWETTKQETRVKAREQEGFNRIMGYCIGNEMRLVEAGADAMLEAIREEIEKALLTEKECMELSGDNTPLSSDEWEKVSIWARGLVAKAQLQKILKIMSSREG